MSDPETERMIQDLIRQPYHRVISGDPEEGYLGEVVELPGCYTAGQTPQEALANLDEAMAVWLETALAHGDPIPRPATGRVLIAG